METRQQRSDQNDFEAPGEESAKLSLQKNANLAWYSDKLFAKMHALCLWPTGTFKKSS